MKAQASIVPGLLLLAQIVGEEALKFEDWGRILVLRWRGAHDWSVSLSGCSRRHGRGNACSIAWSSLHVVVRSLFAPVEAIHKILHIDLSKHWSESRLRSQSVLHHFHFRGKVGEAAVVFQFTDAFNVDARRAALLASTLALKVVLEPPTVTDMPPSNFSRMLFWRIVLPGLICDCFSTFHFASS